MSEDGKSRGPGSLISACAIDLPADDVVEAIDFERFFRLNITYGDLEGPLILDIGRPENALFPALPLSDDREQWSRMSRRPADNVRAVGDPDPDPLQIGSLALALYLPYQQAWRLDGYTRGRIVNSFSLGPGEEQTVEVFTWDRRTTSMESTSSLEQEQGTESSGSRRDTSDVAADVSRQSGFELTSGGKVGFTVGVVKADLNAGLTARTGVNEAEKSTRNSIVEATIRATGRVRTSRTLKVSETAETGREERVTRTLRNANACHTLTVPFFEILANYCVATRVRTDGIRLVVLIPSNKLSGLKSFNRRTVRGHETALRLALLDRELEPGFAAARLLDARERACGVLCTGCSCGSDTPAGGASSEWTAVAAAANRVADAVRTIRASFVRYPTSIPEAVAGLQSGTDDIQRYLFLKTVEANAPGLLDNLAGVGIAGAGGTVSIGQAESLAGVLAGVAAEAWPLLEFDQTVSSNVSTDIFRYIWMFITFGELISAGIALAALKANTNDLKTYDDAGLLIAINSFKVAYDAWTKVRAEEQQRNERLAELARIAKEEREQRILSAFPLYDTAIAEERLQALLDHLNDPRNVDHYRFAVWNERAGAADDNVMMLALAGFVDPTPVGIVGDQLAVPVRLDRDPTLAAFFADSIADLVETPIVDEKRHILTTAALYAEAVVGQCGSCEPELAKRWQLETDRLSLANELATTEVNRRKARLAADPPDLGLFDCCAPAIQVEVGRRHHHDGDEDRAS